MNLETLFITYSPMQLRQIFNVAAPEDRRDQLVKLAGVSQMRAVELIAAYFNSPKNFRINLWQMCHIAEDRRNAPLLDPANKGIESAELTRGDGSSFWCSQNADGTYELAFHPAPIVKKNLTLEELLVALNNTCAANP